MTSRDVAYALSVRTRSARKQRHRTSSPEVLLEQRPASGTVMPGMWELPSLLDSNVPAGQLCMTLRHSIMQVNYYVRIRTASEREVESMSVKHGKRRWIPVRQAANMALTGLTLKVLKRAHLLPTVQVDAIVL